MASYLVTGGAGFIGSNIVEELLGRGEAVRVLDDFSGGKRENLDFVQRCRPAVSNYELIEGDIRDMDTCRRACGDIDYVLHQAALRSVPRSVDEPSTTNEVNVQGTLNILLAAREAGVKRVVYASSSSVYGDSPVLPQIETQIPSPISPYAVSKLASEYYCSVFSKIYGLGTVCLRYFNVFGPRQDPESQYAAVIPRFILSAFQGERLEIHGDGLQSRDFTYVSNVVEANLLAAKAAGINGEVMNIACGEQYSLLSVADAIAEILSKKLERYHTEPRKGDIRHSLADVSKARSLLGYQNHVTLVDGLRKTVEYFRDLINHDE
ncbi:SDR family oxidoreductase [Chloroflexota bacterium]